MSAFTRYAARSERATALSLRTPVELLDRIGALHLGALGYTTPVSGDMIATMTRGTRMQQYRRRGQALLADNEEAGS